MRTTDTCFLPELKETVERSIQMQQLQLITIPISIASKSL